MNVKEESPSKKANEALKSAKYEKMKMKQNKFLSGKKEQMQ